MSTESNNDARNKEIADGHGMDLLQAEVFFTIIDIMALHFKGTVCYHGDEPPMAVLLLMLKMKADGFKLTPERFHNHVRLMNAHNLVHNTDQGDKLVKDHRDEHGTMEVNLPSSEDKHVPVNRLKGLEDN